MILVTLDTNVLIGGVDGTPEDKAVFQRLWKLWTGKCIDIALTSRFDQDKADDQDLERVKRQYRIARMFPVVPAPFRLGVSMLGQDVLVGKDFKPIQHLFGVEDVASANRHTMWDVDHLYGHLMAKRDYFLTAERRILKKEASLARLGIKVLHPARLIDAIARVQNSSAQCRQSTSTVNIQQIDEVIEAQT